MTEIEGRDDRKLNNHGPRHVPEPSKERHGMAKFLGLNLAIWATAVLLTVVFLAIILVYAL